MKALAILYGRGLVFTILVVIIVAICAGYANFIVHEPVFAIGLLVLLILPFFIGIMTEG